MFISSIVIVIFSDQELTLRKMSFVAVDLSIEKNLTLVLDELPDGVIIADPRALLYMNNEAWKLLKCVSPEEGVNEQRGLEGVVCLDVGSCAILTPLE